MYIAVVVMEAVTTKALEILAAVMVEVTDEPIVNHDSRILIPQNLVNFLFGCHWI